MLGIWYGVFVTVSSGVRFRNCDLHLHLWMVFFSEARITPRHEYERRVAAGHLQRDEYQLRLIDRFEQLAIELRTYEPPKTSAVASVSQSACPAHGGNTYCQLGGSRSIRAINRYSGRFFRISVYEAISTSIDGPKREKASTAWDLFVRQCRLVGSV